MIRDVNTDKKYSRVTSFAGAKYTNKFNRGWRQTKRGPPYHFEWASECNMNFNAVKCEIIRYSPTRSPKPRSDSVEGIKIK